MVIDPATTSTESTRNPERTRSALLRAAIESIERGGDDGVRLGQIAKEAGVTTGAIYALFGSREGLRAAAHFEQLRDNLQRSHAARVSVRDDSPGFANGTEVYRAMAQRFFAEDAQLERRQWADAISSVHRDGFMSDQVQRLFRAGIEALAEQIADSQKRGWTDPDVDPVQVATVLESVALGFAMVSDLVDTAPEFRAGTTEIWARMCHTLTPEGAAQLAA